MTHLKVFIALCFALGIAIVCWIKFGFLIGTALAGIIDLAIAAWLRPIPREPDLLAGMPTRSSNPHWIWAENGTIDAYAMDARDRKANSTDPDSRPSPSS